MEWKLFSWSWRKSTTMRRCQNPLNSLSRNMESSAGRGTLKRDHSLPRPGSGRMWGTICLPSGRCLHPNASCCPQRLSQSLRRNWKEKFTCLSDSHQRLGQSFFVFCLWHCSLSCTVTKSTCYAPCTPRSPGIRLLRERDVTVGGRQFEVEATDTCNSSGRMSTAWTSERGCSPLSGLQ